VDLRRWTALVVFALFALASGELGAAVGRPAARLGLIALPCLLLWRDRPALLGATMVAAGVWFRAAIAYAGPMTDQIEASQAAWDGLFAGLNPYGREIVGTSTNAPFPYGPLALPAYIPGVWTEIAAAGLVMAILARHRAWLTLAVFAACPLTVRGAVMGLNDTLPGLLILLAMLEARRSTVRGAALLALAAGVKPYSVAWLPGIVGLGGVAAVASFSMVSLAVWSPVILVWGASAFLRSLQMAQDVHAGSSSVLDIPALRLLAAPAAALAMFLRSWQAAVWLGLATYLTFLFFTSWASLGYLLAVLPLAGLTLESLRDEPAGRAERAPVPDGGSVSAAGEAAS
jgi:hypothetical protein